MEQKFSQQLSDFEQAKKVRAMQHNPSRHHIGVMRQSFSGTMGGIKAGDVVLFEPDGDGQCTIETPLPDEWIAREREKGSLITTFRICVGVKMKDVDEVPL